MESQKLLSIVVPTYNRVDMLLYTLTLFHDQVERNSDVVDLIVCDNASTDDTYKKILEIQQLQGNWFSIIHYDEHVEVGQSISRSADNANGKFFLLWGDDDVPSPVLIDSILLSIKKYPNIGILLLTKADGWSDTSVSINDIVLSNGNENFHSYETLYNNIQDFAESNYYRMGLLSVDVVRTECWRIGKNEFSDRHLGYEFISQMLLGAKKYPCLCLNWLLVIQRNPMPESKYQHTFLKKWPIFAYVGIPRLLRDLNKMGLVSNWEKIYKKNPFNEKTSVFMGTIMGATNDGKNDDLLNYIDELCSYQDDRFRVRYARMLATTQGWKHKLLTIYIKFIIDKKGYLISLPKKIIRRIK